MFTPSVLTLVRTAWIGWDVYRTDGELVSGYPAGVVSLIEPPQPSMAKRTDHELILPCAAVQLSIDSLICPTLTQTHEGCPTRCPPRAYATSPTGTAPSFPRRGASGAPPSPQTARAAGGTWATALRRGRGRQWHGSRTNRGPLGGREGDSNPVGVRAELEASFPQSLPHPGAGTRLRYLSPKRPVRARARLVQPPESPCAHIKLLRLRSIGPANGVA